MTGGTGDDSAEHRFLEMYDALRREAHRIVSREIDAGSVEATSLVHEAYEHVVRKNSKKESFEDSKHLLNALTLKMHRLLMDHARRRNARKRGDGRRPVEIDLHGVPIQQLEASELLSLHQALDELWEKSQDSGLLVRWHIYGGLTIAETAAQMGISRSRADKLWLHARHWLRRRMENPES